MRGVALALPEASEQRIRHQLREGGVRVCAHFASDREVIEMVGTTRSLTQLIVSAHPAFLTAEVVAAVDAAGVRVIAVADTDTERHWAHILGLSVVLSSTDEWEVWQDALAGPLPGRSAAVECRPARVIGVWGPAGAPGRTTVAINLAAELARTGASVLLVDADTYSGSIAPALGLSDEAPGFAAACRLASTSSLSTEQIERLAAHCGERAAAFRVLSGVSNPARWAEFGGDRTAAVLRSCSEWADITVVDVGFSLEEAHEGFDEGFLPHRNSTTLAALHSADLVVAVGSADPVGLARFIRGHADLRAMLPNTPLIEVINRVRAGAIGPSPASQLRHTLGRFGGITRPYLIPYDRSLADAALLSGRTWAETGGRSAARAAVRAIAQQISDYHTSPGESLSHTPRTPLVHTLRTGSAQGSAPGSSSTVAPIPRKRRRRVA